MNFSKKTIPATLAIPILAAVIALSVGITLAVAHMSRPADRTDDLSRQTAEQSLPLYNPEINSCFFRISLVLDGETIWRSGLLAPGQSVTQQTLERTLAAGEYSATLKYECFANQAGTASLNGSEIGFTLHVR